MSPAAKTPPKSSGLRRGNPGNKGGTGRPPSKVREIARRGLLKALPNIVRIACGEAIVRMKLPDGTESQTKVSASPGDQTRATDLLIKCSGELLEQAAESGLVVQIVGGLGLQG